MPSGGPQPVPSGSRPHGHHQPSQHRSKRRRRNHSEVSCCLKYVIFGFNVIFWLIGLSILAIGVWAWTEKDTFNNLSLLTNVALDPAFIFIWAGKKTLVLVLLFSTLNFLVKGKKWVFWSKIKKQKTKLWLKISSYTIHTYYLYESDFFSYKNSNLLKNIF